MSLNGLVGDLSAAFGDRLRRNEPLSGHTTLRVGGPADIWLAVEIVDELVKAVSLARQHDVPVFVLGGGANLLIGEAGIRGLVIGNRTNKVTFPAATGQETLSGGSVLVDSGVVLPNLARRCARRGLSGLEWAVGVPGTVGGAIINNAGAYRQDMASTLEQAELLSPAHERVWQPVSWFGYGYRTSRLKGVQSLGSEEVTGKEWQWIVLRAELRLMPAPVETVQETMGNFNQRRKASQPPGATIGSMFKNPPGDYAGRLIEAAGLKGRQVGQARISPVHANFFQNLGQATGADMMALIKLAQESVEQKFGVKLELEIEVIGESYGKA